MINKVFIMLSPLTSDTKRIYNVRILHSVNNLGNSKSAMLRVSRSKKGENEDKNKVTTVLITLYYARCCNTLQNDVLEFCMSIVSTVYSKIHCCIMQ